jgi:hypothetical protein
MSPREKEFSGPLIVKHIGVCAPGWPAEMSGKIRYRTTGWIATRMQGTLVIEGGFMAAEGGWRDVSCEQGAGACHPGGGDRPKSKEQPHANQIAVSFAVECLSLGVFASAFITRNKLEISRRCAMASAV